MVFHISSFTCLNFWYAAWNALVFWKVIDLHNRWEPHKVTLSHRVVNFIQLLPLTRRWTEVTWGLRQLMVGIQPFAPFTYQGLVEFLVLVEDQLDNLGNHPLERQHAVN